jgi:hypothetical protein
VTEPCQHQRYKTECKFTFMNLVCGELKMRQPMILLRVKCTECMRYLVFKGTEIGIGSSRPMISPDGYELRAPVEFPDEDIDVPQDDGTKPIPDVVH